MKVANTRAMNGESTQITNRTIKKCEGFRCPATSVKATEAAAPVRTATSAAVRSGPRNALAALSGPTSEIIYNGLLQLCFRNSPLWPVSELYNVSIKASVFTNCPENLLHGSRIFACYNCSEDVCSSSAF